MGPSPFTCGLSWRFCQGRGRVTSKGRNSLIPRSLPCLLDGSLISQRSARVPVQLYVLHTGATAIKRQYQFLNDRPPAWKCEARFLEMKIMARYCQNFKELELKRPQCQLDKTNFEEKMTTKRHLLTILRCNHLLHKLMYA